MRLLLLSPLSICEFKLYSETNIFSCMGKSTQDLLILVSLIGIKKN